MKTEKSFNETIACLEKKATAQRIVTGVFLLFLIFILIVLLALTSVRDACGHGTHMAESSGPIIGQKNIGFSQTVWYLDYNENDRPDRVKVIMFIKNDKHPQGIFHILFNDTYPKFIREYGKEYSFYRAWKAK